MKLATAQQIAARVVEMLTPGCMRIQIAGSVRRESPEVKDIEIVALPKLVVESAMFDVTSERSELDELLSRHIKSGALTLDQQVRRNGPLYKKLRFEGISIDLFIAAEANYGNTLALRTGDATFSRLLVTARRYGGLMPTHLEQRGGYLWDEADLVACHTEHEYFDALGVMWVFPQVRNEATALSLARSLYVRA